MAKFNVGNRVRRVDGKYSDMSAGDEDTVVSCDFRGAVTLEKYGFGHADYALELVTPAPVASPIRTITKREIVDGTYGMVVVNGGRFTCGWIDSAQDLRATAALFNDIALALDENAKDAA